MKRSFNVSPLESTNRSLLKYFGLPGEYFMAYFHKETPIAAIDIAPLFASAYTLQCHKVTPTLDVRHWTARTSRQLGTWKHAAPSRASRVPLAGQWTSRYSIHWCSHSACFVWCFGAEQVVSQPLPGVLRVPCRKVIETWERKNLLTMCYWTNHTIMQLSWNISASSSILLCKIEACNV